VFLSFTAGLEITDTQVIEKRQGFVQTPPENNPAAVYDQDCVRRLKKYLIVTDHDRRRPVVLLLSFEKIHHGADGPEIDPRIGFIVDGQFGVAGDGGCQFDLLDLAAGEFRVHRLVEKIQGADSHPHEQFDEFLFLFDARGQAQQFPEGDALETGRLLETVSDARLGAVSDGIFRNVTNLKENGAGGYRIDPHDQFCQGGLAAPVGAGDGVEFPLFEIEIESVDDPALFSAFGAIHIKVQIPEFQHRRQPF